MEGESGLLRVFPESQRPTYYPSKRRVEFHNGAVAFCYSAEEPERLRGPQHHSAWCDELAAWKYPQDTWDNLMMGLRLGADPRCVVTTTPRPIQTLKSIIKDPHTRTTRASTFDNRDNLAPGFIDAILTRYEGTRLGRQELYAELLEDNPGALWKRQQIDDLRVAQAPDLVRVVVGVDPSATAGGDETGIVVVGKGADGHLYVIGDHSTKGTPQAWGTAANRAFIGSKADRVIYEANQGGDMVAHVLRTVNPSIPLKAVHASRGKRTRAEPISALYEQGKVHHVGSHAILEDQMCEWTPDDPGAHSPDRMDALVWACTELGARRTVEARIL